MEALWMLLLLVVPLLCLTSSTFVFYFKKVFYVAYMMLLAMITIPLCVLKSGGMMEVLPDRCTPIAKKELLWAGTVGLVCWLGGVVFINRKKTSDAKSVMEDAAKTMLQDQIRLWVFPEGTRNQKGDILPFKKGAFHLAIQAQVSVLHLHLPAFAPVYFVYTHTRSLYWLNADYTVNSDRTGARGGGGKSLV
uniref:1-acylglycerol-3-phosphate O-acyltransferase n=1 Tax=Astyanax mexicanus TaxID=7994 RepID=A0A8B9HT35_ASTMX